MANMGHGESSGGNAGGVRGGNSLQSLARVTVGEDKENVVEVRFQDETSHGGMGMGRRNPWLYGEAGAD